MAKLTLDDFTKVIKELDKLLTVCKRNIKKYKKSSNEVDAAFWKGKEDAYAEAMVILMNYLEVS